MYVQYGYRAQQALGLLPLDVKQRITDKISFFADQENLYQFAKYISIYKMYRFKVGDYRVFFKIIHRTLWIVGIERRDKAYD